MSECEIDPVRTDNTEGVLLHYSWVKLLHKSDPEDAKAIMWHLICHVMGEEAEKPDGMAGGVCDMIEEAVDIGREKSDISRNKKREGGKLGGQKSGETRRRKKAEAESQTVGIPSLAEVESYANEYSKTHGAGMPSDRFFEYFTKRGWKDQDGNEIRDWRQMYNAISRKYTDEKSNTPSYDLDKFIELAMSRSFEDCE